VRNKNSSGTPKTKPACRLLGPVVVAAIGVGLWPALAGASATAGRIDGHYRVTSTDCYFSGGKCTATFDIEQTGTKLSDPADALFHGHVLGTHVVFGEIFPPGTSEDGWRCTGTSSDRGHTVRGTMTDGIGGSGTFVAQYVSS
jgi:hypothetical protein